jgi:hypothetical protein
MNTLKESDLQFTFADHYIVKSYDDQPFYKSFSGRGLRGVDFIGLHPNGEAWLLEVKNYTHRPAQEQANLRQKLTGDQPLLFQQVQQKIADTKRAIAAINDYLCQKWWYRWRYQLLSRLYPDLLLQQERMYWMEAASRLERMTAYVWLELPETWDEEQENLRELAVDYSFKMIDQTGLPNFLTSVTD